MTAFHHEAMGIETSANEVALDPQAGIAYALATNDPIPAHLNGSFIPPIYAVVPAWEKVFEIVSSVVPEEHFFFIVHGEQDMIFHQPLKSSISLKSSAIGESISVKESGTTLVVKTTSRDATSGDLVVEQYFTMFFRGVDGGENYGEPHNSGLDLSQYQDITSSQQPNVSVEAHIDDDQTFRYADASGDRMPIHLDADFAKSVGLPGIIVHGLCTMAHASWAAITQLCANDPARLARMSVRFSKPLLPGDDLTTNFYPADGALEDENHSNFVFASVRSSDQTPILTNAFVQVRD
jgi:acyl dehydratase